MTSSETVFALATAPGRAALSLIRVSGPAVMVVVENLTRRRSPPARRASLRALFDPQSGEKIDEAVLTRFSAPQSFTGEDSVEISVHGARSVISILTRVLSDMPGVRAAEPGEFTRRAFLNGKLDLSQAEAIADLIDSETEYQRRQALRVLDGGLGQRASKWRGMLLDISAELESQLDFSDEGDVQARAQFELETKCSALEAELTAELTASRRSAALRQGFTVLIAGPPNAGKSTLFNALVGREAAIVTNVPGTTRDLIEAKLDLGGVPVTLIDSAGLRDSDDPVERIGVERAYRTAESASLVLGLSSADTQSLEAAVRLGAAAVLPIWSKCDQSPPPVGRIGVSAREPATLAALADEIRRRAIEEVGDGSEGELIRARHISAVTTGRDAITRARSNVVAGAVELAAEDCRIARQRLGELTGETLTEDVLSEIFARFCVGK